jgi:hypothetical protein
MGTDGEYRRYGTARKTAPLGGDPGCIASRAVVDPGSAINVIRKANLGDGRQPTMKSEPVDHVRPPPKRSKALEVSESLTSKKLTESFLYMKDLTTTQLHPD